MNQEQALQFLTRDIPFHIDMIESIQRGTAQLLKVSDRGVLLFNTDCDAYMMSTEDEETAHRMIDDLKQAGLVAAHQDFYIKDIQSKFGLDEQIVCYQAAYLRKQPLAMPHSRFTIRRLGEDHLPFIREHYSRDAGDDYLLGRIRSGVMYGAFDGQNLLGFIGLHEEGSIGMLEVLPEYRLQGIGSGLEIFLTNQLLDKGFTPFAQIVAGNTVSMELHRKLNYSISEKTICWLE